MRDTNYLKYNNCSYFASELSMNEHCAGQYNEATSEASHALEFLKETYAYELDGYDGDSVQYVVAVLRLRFTENDSYVRLQDYHIRRTSRPPIDCDNNSNSARRLTDPSSLPGDRRHSVTMATPPDVAMGDGDPRGFFDAADAVEEYANGDRRATDAALGGAVPPANSSGPEAETKSNNRSSSSSPTLPPPSDFEHHTYVERLLQIAHIFHFVSIAILGIFVIQV